MRHAPWAVAALSFALFARGSAAEDDAKAGAPARVDVPGFWTEEELRRIDEGLEVLNVTRADLGFQKRPIDDPFRLAVVDRILDEPLAIGEVAAEWDEVARRGEAGRLCAKAIDTLGLDASAGLCATIEMPEGITSRLPGGESLALRLLLASLETLGAGPLGALHPLGDRRDAFLAKALLSQVENPAQRPAAVPLDDAAFLEALARVDRARLGHEVSSTLGSIAAFVAGVRTPIEWEGKFAVEHAIGRIVLYGTGDDVHGDDDGDAVLVIDLGGNDTYLRGASANLLEGRSKRVVIDLSGDDLYIGRNDFSFGGALGGVAIQWDCAGDDTYLGGNVSCGAAIFGTGVLVDEGGNDTYRIKDFGQGAGAFGIGLLLDKSGQDLYHADLFGQGFASTWGCGMLVDLDGNDVYDAGGDLLHAPLWRDRFQSLSQGFAIGMRPEASGGVGVLVDVAGNDRYSADIYGQGASYWYSLGLLIDDDGHDTYCLGQYGQGSGIHLSAGMLLDRAGQDGYYDANGVGMGGAHDFSVGFLVDRGGDDYYAGGGGAQGGALTNSVAMLIDTAGDDGYAAVRDGTHGSATSARNTGGIGLLLDGAGADRYTETTRNDGIRVKDNVGALLDTPTPAERPSVDAMSAAMSKEDATRRVEEDGRSPGPDGAPAWDLDKLWKLVTQWEVGDNTVIMPIARERFFALGAPALDRALENLNAKDSLITRTIELTVKAFPREQVVPRLLEKTHDADKFVRKNSVAMLSALQANEAVPRLTEMLTTDPDTTGTVLAALATLKTAPPAVVGLLRAPKEAVAVQAAVCLGAVGDETAIAALVGALGPDYAFPVRLAAQERLAALGAAAVPALARASRDAPSAIARRNALRALGSAKAVEASVPIGEALADTDPLVRLSAMTAATELLKSIPANASLWLQSALDRARDAETDPRLRRVR